MVKEIKKKADPEKISEKRVKKLTKRIQKANKTESARLNGQNVLNIDTKSVKNKEVRMRIAKKQKDEKNLRKRLERFKRQKMREELGVEVPLYIYIYIYIFSLVPFRRTKQLTI